VIDTRFLWSKQALYLQFRQPERFKNKEQRCHWSTETLILIASTLYSLIDSNRLHYNHRQFLYLSLRKYVTSSFVAMLAAAFVVLTSCDNNIETADDSPNTACQLQMTNNMPNADTLAVIIRRTNPVQVHRLDNHFQCPTRGIQLYQGYLWLM
jgi:hypothetical protein